MRPYEDLPALAGIFLEESYVLDVQAHPATLHFLMDLVLTPLHPEYTTPKNRDTQEQYCYRRGTIIFSRVRRILWQDQGTPPARDAAGELDYGNIDSFAWEGDSYRLNGDWGDLEITAGELDVRIQQGNIGD
jgi:hypothetical protein